MKKTKRVLSMVLALVMVLGLAPITVSQSAEAAGCIDVYIGGCRIGNNGYGAENLMPCFPNGVGVGQPGFHTVTYKHNGGSMGNFCLNDNAYVEYKLVPAENEVLAALAQPGSGAEYRIWARCKSDEDYRAFHGNCYDMTCCKVYKNGGSRPVFSHYSTRDEKNRMAENYWKSFEGITELKIVLHGYMGGDYGAGGANAQAEVQLFIRDTKNPSMTYTFTTNGTEHTKEDGTPELLLKLGTIAEDDPDARYADDENNSNIKSTAEKPYIQNYIDMKLSFTEPVKGKDVVVSLDAENNTAVEAAQDAMDDAAEAYYTAVSKLQELSNAVDAAQEEADSLTEKQNMLRYALEVVLEGAKVQSGSAAGGEKTYTISNPMAELFDKDSLSNGDLTEFCAALEAKMPTTEGTGAQKSITSLDTEVSAILKVAAPAIKTAQQTALDNMSDAAKANLDGKAFTSDTTVIQAAFSAISGKTLNAYATEKTRTVETTVTTNIPASEGVTEREEIEATKTDTQLSFTTTFSGTTPSGDGTASMETNFGGMTVTTTSRMTSGTPTESSTGPETVQVSVDLDDDTTKDVSATRTTSTKTTESTTDSHSKVVVSSLSTVNTVQEGVSMLYDATALQQALTKAQNAYSAKETEIEKDGGVKKVFEAKTEAYNTAIDQAEASASATLPEGYQALVEHKLFDNTLGTGYARMGLPCNLDLYKGESLSKQNGQYKSTELVTNTYRYTGGTPVAGSAVLLSKYSNSLSYRYTAQKGDYYGGNPVPNDGNIDALLTGLGGILHDAAGNPMTAVNANSGMNIFKSQSPSDSGKNKVVKSSGDGTSVSEVNTHATGYKVIVDAEPPTYTRTGNGISPDILTQVIVNKNDSFDFIVSFSEGTYTNREFSGGDTKTYLLLNNGDRAYFKSKSTNGKVWTFHYDPLEGTKEEETSQLLVIGLCNDALDKKLNTDAKGAIDTRTNIAKVSYNADARTITDYVGNVMADRANENALTNKNQIESDTSWAGITIDNTKPEISFSYLPYTATMQRSSANANGTVTDVANPWGQAAKILVTAVDPQIATPKYNPDQSVAMRSTKGIFRPDNASSASSSETSASGLIYYLWTPSDMAADVEANFAGTNYEVIKRFSLAGWDQTAVDAMNGTLSGAPAAYKEWKDLYNYGDFGLRLSMVNNGSLIQPPEELITGDYSGKWTLHVWTADMSWDSARQLMQYRMMYDLKFNTGYDPASAVTEKMEMIEAKFDAEVRKNDKYTYDDAWKDVRDSYFNTVYTADYMKLLQEYQTNTGKAYYTDDAELYARNQTMKKVGDYGALANEAGTALWSWDKFNQDDSNWTYQPAEVWFDNTKPVIAADQANVTGNNTKSVKATFTVTDAHSGVDTAEVYYQWVKLPEDAGEVTALPDTNSLTGEWVKVSCDSQADGSASFTAVTLNDPNVDEDGVYALYVRASDRASNETSKPTEVCVTVRLNVNASCEFGQVEEAAEYYRSVTPTLHVTELKIETVKYAVTNSIAKPDAGAYKEIAATTETSETDKTYQLPALNAEMENYEDGTWYVHVVVTENAEEPAGPFDFSKSYQLDNTAPTLYLNPDGSGLAKESASATVTATDERSGVDANTLYYIWTTSEDTPAVDADWKPVVSGEAVTKKISDASENGSYYLHAKVADNIGNAATACSKAFVLEVEVPEVVASYASGLLTVYQEDEEFYGIATLDLEADEKSGYRYSFSSDGGASWSSWLPYSSMAKLKLPIKAAEEAAGLAGQLQVKFRAPGGTVGEPLSIAVDGLDANDQLWAVMTVESLVPRKDGDLTLLVEKPAGVKLEPVEIKDSEENVITPAATVDGNDFKVSANGLYTFKLKDSEGNERTDAEGNVYPFVIVVDVYDTVAPKGAVNLSETAPTSANVIATLETDEAVYVKKIHFTPVDGETVVRSGSPTYTVEENGTVEFLFADAAGNVSSASAAVKNIDRSAPEVEIAVTYSKTYADGSSKSYTSWQHGEQTLSQGAFLTVVQTPGSKKSFEVVSGDLSGTMEITENGTYSFTVQDSLGNVRKVSITFGENEKYAIAEKIGEPEVNLSFKERPKTLRESDLTKAQINAAGGDKAAALTAAQNAEDARAAAAILKVDGSPKDTKTDYCYAYVEAEVRIPAPADGRMIYLGRDGTKQLDLVEGYYVYTKTYQANCETSLCFNDGHGGTIKVPVKVTGIDTTRPTLTLNQPTVVLKVDKNKPTASYDLKELGGGYTVTDGDRSAEGATVEVRDLYGAAMKITGSTTPGAYTAQYYVRDSAGNENFTEQTVYVIDANDLFIQADNALLANNASNTAILATNRVTFKVSEKEMQQMFYRDQRAYNRDMRYDVYYTTGLYREGQLKYIAEKLTGEELKARNFTVTFAKTGWYTIIIRNQERSRVYTSFFVSSMEG